MRMGIKKAEMDISRGEVCSRAKMRRGIVPDNVVGWASLPFALILPVKLNPVGL